MAFLNNTARTMRFQFTLADRETRPPGHATSPTAGRVLSRVALEHFDHQDQAFWPFIRLPASWFDLTETQGLVEALEELVRGERPGFAFHSQPTAELGIQVGRLEEADRFAIEIGIDLQRFLGQISGGAGQPGEDLALFRFSAGRPELVAFADALRTELRELLERGKPTQPPSR